MAWRISWYIHLLLSGLLAGILVGVWFVEQALLELPAQAYIAVEQPKHRIFEPIMPVVMTATLISGLLVFGLMLVYRSKLIPSLAVGIAVVCTAILIATTLLNNVPINGEIMHNWSAQSPPANWIEVRDRWNLWHGVRTVLAIVALGCQLLAACLLIPQPRRAATHTQAPVLAHND